MTAEVREDHRAYAAGLLSAPVDADIWREAVAQALADAEELGRTVGATITATAWLRRMAAGRRDAAEHMRPERRRRELARAGAILAAADELERSLAIPADPTRLHRWAANENPDVITFGFADRCLACGVHRWNPMLGARAQASNETAAGPCPGRKEPR